MLHASSDTRTLSHVPKVSEGPEAEGMQRHSAVRTPRHSPHQGLWTPPYDSAV